MSKKLYRALIMGTSRQPAQFDICFAAEDYEPERELLKMAQEWGQDSPSGDLDDFWFSAVTNLKEIESAADIPPQWQSCYIPYGDSTAEGRGLNTAELLEVYKKENDKIITVNGNRYRLIED